MAGQSVLMLLENNPYPADVRVRLEAQSLRAAGYDITVVAPRGRGEPAREVVDGVKVRRFRLPALGGSPPAFVAEYAVANLQLHARGLLGLRRADVLHLHNPPDTLFGIGLVARLLGKRVVFDHHDIAPELFAEKFGEGPVVKLLRLFERLSYRVAHSVLVVNRSLKQIAVDRGNVGADRVFVVRNAPPRELLAGVAPARPGALAEPRLVFVGSMGSQDGVDDLPALMVALRENHGLRPKLTVVGDGDRRPFVEQAVADAGLGDDVTFTGRLPHARIPEVLADADICVEPAGCSELNHRCSMVKVYEYMASGRPIVAFPLREVQWLGGEHIRYAPCDDIGGLAAEIAALAADEQLRARCAAGLRERAERYTWERSTESLLDAYSALRPATVGS
jgi:glycosyltransferase involved in cell wall biosynthesis